MGSILNGFIDAVKLSTITQSKSTIMLYFMPTFIYIFLKLNQLRVTPIEFPDTSSYVRVSQYSLFDLNFYMSSRPFTYPLLLKISDSNNFEVILFQVIFSCISWIFLALVVTRLFKSRVIKYSAYLTILLLSLSTLITQWDVMILTESISFSLFAIFLAFNILFTINKINKTLLLSIIIVVGMLFSFTRNGNSYVILQTAVIYLLSYIAYIVMSYLKESNTDIRTFPYIIITIPFFIIYYVQQHLIAYAHSWNSCLRNIFGKRILPNSEYTEYFVSKFGMPLNEDILLCSGHHASSVNCNYANQSEFRTWIQHNGPEAYKSFLISHISDVVHIYLGLIPGALNIDTNTTYMLSAEAITIYKNNYFSIPQKIFFNDLWDTLFSAFLAISAIIILLFVIRPHLNSDYLIQYSIILSLFFVSLGQVFLGYFGDAIEVQRHSLLATISFKLSFIMLIFTFIEILTIGFFGVLGCKHE
jgi:hypothetical protein